MADEPKTVVMATAVDAVAVADEMAPEALLPRRLLRLAAAQADVAEATALRAAMGFPTRGDAREKVLAALRALGVDVDALPQAVALRRFR